MARIPVTIYFYRLNFGTNVTTHSSALELAAEWWTQSKRCPNLINLLLEMVGETGKLDFHDSSVTYNHGYDQSPYMGVPILAGHLPY